MNTRKTPEQQLEALEKKSGQINARIQKKRAQVRGAERKKDTRRKIIAGAIALEHMAHDKQFATAMRQLIHDQVKPQDKKLFDL